MATYRLTRHAQRDLLEIWQRIAEMTSRRRTG